MSMSFKNRTLLVAGLLLSASGYVSADTPSSFEIKSLVTASKGTPEFNLFSGREAFLNYDFDKASDYFDTYRAAKKKSSRDEFLLPVFQQQLEVAESALENVQMIKLISRSIADENNFLSLLKLPASAGSFLPSDSIPFEKGKQEATVAYVNEGRDYMIWSQRNSEDTSDSDIVSEENYILVESELLTDGTWSEPQPLKGLGTAGLNADYPFLRADGTTLYFSAPAEGSMGGYDLFVASRDPQSGEFLAPRNLGMPFNSPYDDHMVAIDEENGLGWLVTGRDMEEGKVAVYLYIFEEARKNYDTDSADIISHARLTNPDDFLPDDDDLRIERIKSLNNSLSSQRVERNDFSIPMPNGKIYHRIENFSSPQARQLAMKYHQLLNSSNEDKAKLEMLRNNYAEAKHKRNTSKINNLSSEILNLERLNETREKELKQLRNQIIQAESPKQ